MSKALLRDAASYVTRVVENNALKCEMLFSQSRTELAQVLQWIEEASEIEHVVVEAFNEIRKAVLLELGPVTNLTDIEHALALKLRALLADPEQMKELVAHVLDDVRAFLAEHAPPVAEPPPAEPTEPAPPAEPVAPAPEEETPPAAVAPDVPPTAPVAAHPAFVQEVQAAAAVVIPEGNASSEPATGKTATGE